MSIRIVNQSNGRTIIVKNQSDMNHLDTSVSSIDDGSDEFTLMPKDEKSDPYSTTTEYGSSSSKSSDINNRRANQTKGNPMFDLDSFDDAEDIHYINATEYPLSDEIQSQSDPSTVDAPINRLKDTDIPDDQTSDEFNLDDDQSNMFGSNQDQEGDVGTDEEGDQDFQGNIRTIRGACLVYKRKTQNGNYDELWIYNVGDDLKKETIVRKAILAGTDIDPNTQQSDDGSQKARTYTVGNVQYLNISGLVQ